MYPFDLSGRRPENAVIEIIGKSFAYWDYVIPTEAPFFTESLRVYDTDTHRYLDPHQDYVVIHGIDALTTLAQSEIATAVVFLKKTVSETLHLTYQTVGDEAKTYLPPSEDIVALVDRTVAPHWGEVVNRETIDPNIAQYLGVMGYVTYHFLVQEIETLRQAILYGDAVDHDRLRELALTARIRYVARIETLMFEFLGQLEQHVQQPHVHQETKAQLGLSEYPNFPPATTAVYLEGSSNYHLVTPKGTALMLDTFFNSVYQQHLKEAPEHALTKAQVGLSQVENYGPATVTEMEQGTRDDCTVTPLTLKLGIQHQFSVPLMEHILEGRSHGIHKAHLGLDLYANYPVATTVVLEAGLSDAHYMTPAGTVYMLRHHYGDRGIFHIEDIQGNPHGLVKEDFGLDRVENYSFHDYLQYFAHITHHHTAEELPFSQEDLDLWIAMGNFVNSVNFFRHDGYYPDLIAGNVTKEDIGLDRVPNMSMTDIEPLFARRTHLHDNKNYAAWGYMRTTKDFAELSDHPTGVFVNLVKHHVHKAIIDGMTNHLIKITDFNRATLPPYCPYISPTGTTKIYLRTQWYVHQIDEGATHRVYAIQWTNPGIQSQIFALIQPGTGRWRVGVIQHSGIGGVSQFSTEIDTGPCMNPFAWVLRGYREIFQRVDIASPLGGANLIGMYQPNITTGGERYGTLSFRDSGGPTYWMTTFAMASADELLFVMAQSKKDSPDADGDRARAWLDIHHPGWNDPEPEPEP